MRPLAVLLLLAAWPLSASAEDPITLTPAVSGLSDPVYLTHAGDGSGRLFIVEQPGRIRIARGSALEPQPFLDIQDRVMSGGEMGLLSAAFHPKFSSNGRFFVNYTAQINGQLTTVIAEYHVPPETPDRASRDERVVLTIKQPFANHNGGQLQFGPDGYLYIGMGDGGGAGDPYGNAQNLQSLLGKMLRIDVDREAPYAIPPDNPFIGLGAPEVWAYGLRNPWRFSFDRATGQLFAADVGQNSWEEVDLVVQGGNYGWNRREGPACFPPPANCGDGQGLVPPVAWYGRATGVCITGGYVYRGQAVPGLQGAYLFGDFVSSKIWALRKDPSNDRWTMSELLQAPVGISSFGEDEAGEVYVVGYQGVILRIDPPASASASR